MEVIGYILLTVMVSRAIYSYHELYKEGVRIRKMMALREKMLKKVRNHDDYAKEALTAYYEGDADRCTEYAEYSRQEFNKIQQIHDEFIRLQNHQ